MANYTNALVVYSAGKLQRITSTDNLSVGGSVYIGGNLEVAGEIISSGSRNVTISDAFLDLNAGYLGGTARSAGLTFNVSANGSAVSITEFVAGVVATSAPKFICSADVSAVFSAGDIVQISGTETIQNNGLFIVQSVSTTDVTIYGIGGTAVPSYALFAQNQFSSVEDNADGTKVDLAVFAVADGSSIKSEMGAAIPKGKYAQAFYEAANVADFNGTAAGTGYIEVGALSDVGLQMAYDNGNEIVLTTGRDLSVAKPASGTAAITLEANAASSFVVDSAALLLHSDGASPESVTVKAGEVSAAGSPPVFTGDGAYIAAKTTAGIGSVEVVSKGDVLIQTPANFAAYVFADSANPASVDLKAFNTGAGSGEIIVETDGQLLLRAGSVPGTSTFQLSLDEVGKLYTGGASALADVDLSVTADIKLAAAGLASSFIMQPNSGSNAAMEISALNDGAGDADLLLKGKTSATLSSSDSVAQVRVEPTEISIGADVNLGELHLAGSNHSGHVYIGQAGSRGISIGNTTTGGSIVLDAGAGVIELNSNGGAIGIGNDADNQNINIGTAGDRTITIGATGGATALALNTGGAFDLNSDGAITLDAGANSHFIVDAADLALETTTSGDLSLASAALFSIDAANAVSINSSGAAISIGDDADAHALNLGTAGARTIAIGSAAASSVTMDAVAVSIDATDDSNLTVTGADLTLSTVSSGFVALSSAQGMNITSNGASPDGNVIIQSMHQNVEITADAAVKLDAAAASYFKVDGAALSLQTVNSGALDVTSAGTMALDAATALSIDSAANSYWDVAAADLRLSTVTSGTLAVSSAGAMDIDAHGALGINSANGAISIGTDADNQNISVGTDGTRAIVIGKTASAATTLSMYSRGGTLTVDAEGQTADISATSVNLTALNGMVLKASGTVGSTLQIKNSANLVLADFRSSSIDIGTATTAVLLGAGSGAAAYTTQAAAGTWLPAPALSAITTGEVLAINSAGVLAKADANGTYKDVVGISLATAGAGAAALAVSTVPGGVVYAKFASAPAAGDVGGPVYLSETAGAVSVAFPTANGARVQKMGILLKATSPGASLYPILFVPQFIADL